MTFLGGYQGYPSYCCVNQPEGKVVKEFPFYGGVRQSPQIRIGQNNHASLSISLRRSMGNIAVTQTYLDFVYAINLL